MWTWINDQEEPVRGRYYVDAGPVLERELAQRAGIGWWGKNTCLINKESGSYFFLAEIILDVELEYDLPATDHCGSCTRCLEACPTDAFPEPYVLDSRNCISYLTIELRDSIPRHLRPKLGNWVFGCDVCQQVCPWNDGAVRTSEPAFETRSGLDAPQLIDLMALDAEGFIELFRRSPVKRPKRAGFLRNVAVALGNSGNRKAVGVLAAALEDEEALVREHAAWALGQIGGKQAKEALTEALNQEENRTVSKEIELALQTIAHHQPPG